MMMFEGLNFEATTTIVRTTGLYWYPILGYCTSRSARPRPARGPSKAQEAPEAPKPGLTVHYLGASSGGVAVVAPANGDL